MALYSPIDFTILLVWICLSYSSIRFVLLIFFFSTYLFSCWIAERVEELWERAWLRIWLSRRERSGLPYLPYCLWTGLLDSCLAMFLLISYFSPFLSDFSADSMMKPSGFGLFRLICFCFDFGKDFVYRVLSQHHLPDSRIDLVTGLDSLNIFIFCVLNSTLADLPVFWAWSLSVSRDCRLLEIDILACWPTNFNWDD